MVSSAIRKTVKTLLVGQKKKKKKSMAQIYIDLYWVTKCRHVIAAEFIAIPEDIRPPWIGFMNKRIKELLALETLEVKKRVQDAYDGQEESDDEQEKASEGDRPVQRGGTTQDPGSVADIRNRQMSVPSSLRLKGI